MNGVESWLRENGAWLRRQPPPPGAAAAGQVTALTVWLWTDERFDLLLDALHAAVLMIRLHAGDLPVTVVANRNTPRLERFAQEVRARIHLAPHIAGGGGNVKSLNVAALTNLHTWFDTPYALSFQHHAFPIRAGLEDFLGPYDFIGAPWIFGKDDAITRLLVGRHCDVGNGAFALRSRRLCELTSHLYRRKYKLLPFCYLLNDDYFIGKLLPRYEPCFRRTMRIAPVDVAGRFALEENVVLYEQLNTTPFGFHGEAAFARLRRDGRVPARLDAAQEAS